MPKQFLKELSYDGSETQFYMPTCTTPTEPTHSIFAPVIQVINNYSDLFQDPRSLPPSRPDFDHTISLKDNTIPLTYDPIVTLASKKT